LEFFRVKRLVGFLLIVLIGSFLLLAFIVARLPEPPLAAAFSAHGIDPAKMDRSRVSLRVDKSARTFEVLYGDTVVRSWFCATGPGIPAGAPAPGAIRPLPRFLMMLRLYPGNKQFEGDFRTPEGRYRLATDFQPSRYYRFALVSYPDVGDQKRSANPGGSVGVHGLLPEMAPLGRLHALARWTRGCIALTNDQIDELDKYVTAGTPIQIDP